MKYHLREALNVLTASVCDSVFILVLDANGVRHTAKMVTNGQTPAAFTLLIKFTLRTCVSE